MIKAGAAKRKKAVTLPTVSTPSKSDQVSDLRSRLKEALIKKGYLDKPTKQNPYPGGYIEDMYDKTVVFYAKYDELFACNYTNSNGVITLGEKQAVERRTVYVVKK